MARAQTLFVCRQCGAEALKWQGQCAHCKAWETLERVTGVRARNQPAAPAQAGALDSASLEAASLPRMTLGSTELDRVFGGGLFPGSVTLLGGEPGIGKSTLLLQVAASLARMAPVVYASGEESVAQVAMRARRLAVEGAQLELVADNSLDAILQRARDRRGALLVIDSIQSMQLEQAESSAGSVTQLRECTAALVRHAKGAPPGGSAVIIVGHVTKDGSIAGPKLLEHMVDTVLYFTSDAGSRFRLLRATKNRFGRVNELGFFAMGETGLKEVRNPSAIFLGRHPRPVPGSVVMVARDGGRPLLIEVQALVDRARASMPRRVAQGVDSNRLSMLLAILSRHADLSLADYDVFVNLVGGLEIEETSTDLPLALALASSLHAQALPQSLAVFGELGLTGEVRPVAFGEERLRELSKLGYSQALMPQDNLPREQAVLEALPGLRLIGVASIAEALSTVFALSPPQPS
ncbi:MAG TPA: DNA repair protein RadA [Steroidobacteraceae bacterium]|jgi:DNA repair protein RadA/Sms